MWFYLSKFSCEEHHSHPPQPFSEMSHLLAPQGVSVGFAHKQQRSQSTITWPIQLWGEHLRCSVSTKIWCYHQNSTGIRDVCTAKWVKARGGACQELSYFLSVFMFQKETTDRSKVMNFCLCLRQHTNSFRTLVEKSGEHIWIFPSTQALHYGWGMSHCSESVK